MIGIQKKWMGNIPVLDVCSVENQQEVLPVIIYFHGFTSAKEHNLPLAFLLAEKGFRVLLPDSILHGEREGHEKSVSEKQIAFWDIVIQNVADLNVIKEDLEKSGLLIENRIGIAGTSMGGITTSAALTKYDWIKVAAVLMGSPKLSTYAEVLLKHYETSNEWNITEDKIQQLFQQIDEIDLSKHPEALENRPLLFWHGNADAVVPFEHAYSFFTEVQNTYDNKEHIHFLKEKGVGHKVTRFAILETVKWFDKYL
ncbi:prolyl oligopeptidase family serine peptidase [Virgibacillus soli]|uniref:Prolyl oligopeptidase family serine peptidase n=1 Tax=Paracerasibacillus soli TaxID=480284 RepID=A0ABU5CNR6_9BACI|nr:prolyl oligopeptidase family serine peptidase [Virgibacillus soli]MDY0407870.1 prolyl oligopeptidase family serine peptidase [Virgibacillus soli]